MKKIKYIAALLAVIALIAGCTQNQRARQFGGSMTYELTPNRTLVTVTWEQDHLWILTRPMHTNETAETYELDEKSSWGVMQGKIVIHEHKE